MTPRMFPIQSQRGAAPHPLLIPWAIAELAYSVYSAECGRSQSLERLAERGGFGPGEMDIYLPGWRDRCKAIDKAILEEREACAQVAHDFIEADLTGRETTPHAVADAIRARGTT